MFGNSYKKLSTDISTFSRENTQQRSTSGSENEDSVLGPWKSENSESLEKDSFLLLIFRDPDGQSYIHIV
jgi:hypothetical protein